MALTPDTPHDKAEHEKKPELDLSSVSGSNAAAEAPPKSAIASLSEEELAKRPKTKGEWFYYAVQQIGGKGAIIAATAVLGYFARYGQRWYGPVPNPFKMINDGMKNAIFHNKFYPLSKKGEKIQRLGQAAISTTVLFWGGAAFSPVMKKLENSQEKIANWYNKKYGTPEDVELAHERLKDKPKQNWWDVMKGRLMAWGLVFSVIASMDLALGKGKLFGKGDPSKYRFDQYEDAFGRWLAGFTRKGKPLWEKPLAKELTEAQQKNGLYRFGKITALDFYATNAGIIIWSFFSRRSAQKRHEKNCKTPEPATIAKTDALSPSSASPEETAEAPQRRHTDAITPARRDVLRPVASHGDRIAKGDTAHGLAP